jgi:hypothetical protein
MAMSMLGVAGHFLHHDLFYPESYPAHWRLENTLPHITELKAKAVHEQIYMLGNPVRALVSDGHTDEPFLYKMRANRELVSDWLSQYDSAGIDVTMSVLGQRSNTAHATGNNDELSAWVAELFSAHPCVKAVQLHNEPHLSNFGGWPADEYVNVFRVYAERIKAARPDIKVLGGAVSSLWWQPGIDWLQQTVEHGLLEFCDGLVMHPYNVDQLPEVDPHWTGAAKTEPNHRERALHAFWDLVQGWNTTGKPLVLSFTEFGYNTATTGTGHTSEIRQANYLSRCFLIFLDARLRGLPLESAHWYDLKDDGNISVGSPGDNPQYRYGLMNFDMTVKKPSFWAMQALAKYFGDTDNFAATDLVVTPVAPVPATLKFKTWRRVSDGKNIIAVWNTEPNAPVTSVKLDVDLLGGTVLQYTADRSPPTPRPKSVINGKLRIDSARFVSRGTWLEITQ